MALNRTQNAWASRIIAVVKNYDGIRAMNRPRAADIALETALTESSLYMFANGNNRESLSLPHDRVGWDHGSVGLFQQQVGGAVNSTANWGSTRECMDVRHSTHSFLAALTAFNWKSYSNWHAAQRVQGSFDPSGGNYRLNDSLAVATRKRLWDSSPRPVPPRQHPAPTPRPPAHGIIGTYRIQRGDTLSSIANRYPHRVTAASIARLNHIRNLDRIYVGEVLLIG